MIKDFKPVVTKTCKYTQSGKDYVKCEIDCLFKAGIIGQIIYHYKYMSQRIKGIMSYVSKLRVKWIFRFSDNIRLLNSVNEFPLKHQSKLLMRIFFLQ